MATRLRADMRTIDRRGLDFVFHWLESSATLTDSLV